MLLATMPPKRQGSDSTTKNKRQNHSLAAVWTVKDIELLIDVLHSIWCSTDDNSASFKPQAWTLVAEALEETHSKGGVKDARSCKDKWKTVSSYHLEVPSNLRPPCSSRSNLRPADVFRMSLGSAGARITVAKHQTWTRRRGRNGRP
jgi:hypothetical protein